MYFVILLSKAIGPFPDRIAAYNYATEKLGLSVGQYFVKSDRAAQNTYSYLPIEKPTIPQFGAI